MRFLVFILVIMLCGCETAKMWREKIPEKFIEIIPKSEAEDVEAALKESGREYYCQNFYASTYPNNKVCYVKITQDAVDHIQIKLLKTPKTLVIDAATTIVVIGYVAFDVLIHSDYHRG